MDGRLQTRIEVAAAVLLVCLVQLGESGECCKAHYNIIGNEVSNEQKWCDNYCCFNLLKYDCCDNILLQAPVDMRMDFCTAWFTAHWYIPVLIVLAILGAIITCCVCCCCACCRNRTSGAVLMPAEPQGMLVVTHQAQPNDQSSSPANPFNTGYVQ
ncbi:uncharacterized protein LOC110445791 [Mizuhopecten yessoensis]|uniref:uncharacterized protein LOC110445791 n=1 Tax=Mizuhopecten yessoensis TaxID=6573 RepID=UPI000B458043|nr:uncharacterized protein LOC110445791 [Mizuhopecten yessoensis]